MIRGLKNRGEGVRDEWYGGARKRRLNGKYSVFLIILQKDERLIIILKYSKYSFWSISQAYKCTYKEYIKYTCNPLTFNFNSATQNNIIPSHFAQFQFILFIYFSDVLKIHFTFLTYMLLFFLFGLACAWNQNFFLVVVYFIILEIFLLDTVFLLSHIFMHIYMPTCTGPGPEKNSINIEKYKDFFFVLF